MKPKKIQFVYLLAICLLSYFTFSSNSSGITGKSVVGCGGGGCHQSGAGATTITLTGIPAPGWVAGTPYNMTVTVTNVSKLYGGFDLTCSAGMITSVETLTTTNGPMELHHITPKTMVSGSVSWNFTWTAPAAGTTVTFAVAGNAVDGNFQPTNDAFGTAVFNHLSAVAAAAPTITAVSSNVAANSATITANINANNDNTATTVQYGLTNAYGLTVGAIPAVVTGNTPVPVSASITGLTPGTLYHYRVVASNAIGTTNDVDRVFTTLPSSVSSIEKTAIQLYPNPAGEALYYQNKDNSADPQFTIVAMNGTVQKVSAEKLSPGKYKILTESLATGTYIVYIELEGKQYHHTFLR